MSSKRKGSLLNRVLGKGKDEEEGGAKGKKGKKNKLEKQPSIREESIHSERRQTMHSVTHGSEAALQYEEDEHQGAPVTAMHLDDAYSPFSDSGSYRQPSAIHVRPESHVHQGHQGGDDYFGHGQFSESPTGTVHHASVHEAPVEHVETGHPNVINLGEHAHHGHAAPEEHVAIAGVSRQPTILSPHHQSTEAPKMLKPGDKMEIDPRNPPTFVVDEGVTLEIGDEENGFVPYEQYLADLAKRPPPSTGGTYIVQGGGDVVIQDENGNVIKTIPGTGANAGRGEPQIHHPPHLIPVLVSLSRRATKPRSLRQHGKPQGQIRTITKSPLKFSSGTLESILEPPVAARGGLFASLFDLVDPLPRQQDQPETLDSTNEDSDVTSIGEVVDESLSLAPAPALAPTRPVPSTPTTPTMAPVELDAPIEQKSPVEQKAPVELDTPVESEAEQYPLGQTLPMAAYSEPPMASPASFEDFDEFDASEYTDSDLALTGSMLDAAKTPTIPFARPSKPSKKTGLKIAGTTFPRAVDGTSPATPIDELSDLSEIILSPARTRSLASDASQRSAVQPDDASHQQELPAPWTAGPDRGPRLYGFQGDYPVQNVPNTQERTVSIATSPSRQNSPTLTHSQAENISPKDQAKEQQEARPSPPPRPIRSPNRPSPANSRHNSLTSVESLPLPPPIAMVRQTHRNPIPIPTSTYPAEKSTQPRLNPSPKILAMIQKFEGTSRETDDLGNVFVGSTRSLSVGPKSRSGSVSSSKMDNGFSSPWMSYNTPPSSRPGTPGSISEFGEQLYPDGGPSNMEIAREVRWKSDGRTSDMVNQANWDLRPVGAPRRGSSSSVYRPSMTPAIPGWEVQPELIREMSLKRLRRAE